MMAGPPAEEPMEQPADMGTATAVLRRRWWYLLPAVFVTYSLAYLDRANYGLGAAAGLATTLHITGEQNSLLGALFFLGYFAFQVPGTALLGKRSPVRMIFVTLMLWGVLAALTGVIRTFWALALDRFLLGVAESCIFPAMLLLLTRWFTRRERSRANTLLIAANPLTVLWMSVITGYLIEAFGWRRTFIYEGLPALAWAVIWIAVVRDWPAQARWMTPDATAQLESRLEEEQRTVAPVKGIRTALLRGDVLLLSAVYFFWSLGIYGFVLWLPTIVRRGAELSMGATGLFSAIPYLVGTLLMLMAAHRSDRTLRRKIMVWPFLLVAGIALWSSFLFANSSFALAFAGLIVAGGCMYAPYGPFFAMVPERVPRTATAEVLALINSAGALGAFAGSYFVGWLQAVTGNARAGYLLMAGALVLSAGLMLLLEEKQPQQSGVARDNEAYNAYERLES
ncbi:MAG TPA: MFS transporter [Terracidiphilus sp.]|nr:MFS transporter [Terracidiphilus sp.]